MISYAALVLIWYIQKIAIEKQESVHCGGLFLQPSNNLFPLWLIDIFVFGFHYLWFTDWQTFLFVATFSSPVPSWIRFLCCSSDKDNC